MEDKKVIFCCMAFQIFLLKRLRYAPSRLSISQYIPLRHLLSFGLECFYILWKRSSHTEMFLEKLVLKICSKFTGEHPCWSVIWIKLLCNFIEIALRYGCSHVNLLHIFRTPFPKSTSGGLLSLWYSSPTQKKSSFLSFSFTFQPQKFMSYKYDFESIYIGALPSLYPYA